MHFVNKKPEDKRIELDKKLKKLKSGQLNKLNIEIKKNKLKNNFKKGIF